jgi:hypothetical protein
MTITMTRPTAAATTATASADPDTSLSVTVNPNGRLSILDISRGATTVAALARRTIGATVHRVALTDNITACLNGDDQDGSGELNWAATHMCAALAGTAFTGPDDIPFVCGPVLFTTTVTGEPVGLSDRQLARLVDAHAVVEHPDTDPLDLPDAQDRDR